MPTLSQSNFCRVIGNARLRPLKVFSPISWYVSFKEIWYFPSSSPTRARILEAMALKDEDEDVMAEGKVMDAV
jgi:hypothetical protein